MYITTVSLQQNALFQSQCLLFSHVLSNIEASTSSSEVGRPTHIKLTSLDGVDASCLDILLLNLKSFFFHSNIAESKTFF